MQLTVWKKNPSVMAVMSHILKCQAPSSDVGPEFTMLKSGARKLPVLIGRPCPHVTMGCFGLISWTSGLPVAGLAAS